MEEKITKPTIETVLIRLNAMEERLGSKLSEAEERLESRITALGEVTATLEGRFDGLERRFDGFESRFDGFEGRFNSFEERLGTRLDRIESLAHASRAEGLELRADFRDLRIRLREHFQCPVESFHPNSRRLLA